MKKVAVIGTRGYSDYEEFKTKVNYYIKNLEEVQFVSGGAKSGGDALIKQFCEDFGYKLIEHLPEWKKYGKKAGMIRNSYIIEDADYLIAFWNEVSKGTKNSIDKARKKGIPIRIVKI